MTPTSAMANVRTIASDRALRAGLYQRVSFGDADAHSVDEQNSDSEADCLSEGWAIVRTYADRRVSASRFSKKARPDWAKMRADVIAGHIDVLVVWEISRSDRKMGTYVGLLDDLREHGVLLRVVSHHKTYDPRNARDRRSLLEEGIDAEYESEKTSQRVRRSTDSRAAKGLPHGRIPYGYIRVYDELSGRLLEQVPHPEQAPVVAEMVRRIAAGQSLNKVALDFDARGIPTPNGGGKWSVMTIRGLVTSTSCIGVRTHKGVEIPGAWPAIAKPEHFYAAAARLGAVSAARKPRDGRAKYLLSYIAFCGEDGETFIAGPKGAYACRHGHNAIKREWLDELVVAWFLRRLAQAGVQETILATDDSAAQAARARISELSLRLDQFRERAALGKLSIEALEKAEETLIPELDKARKVVRAAAVPGGPVTELIGTGVEVRTYQALKARWEGLQLEQQREILRDLVVVTITRAYRRSPSRTEIDKSRVQIRWAFDPQ